MAAGVGSSSDHATGSPELPGPTARRGVESGVGAGGGAASGARSHITPPVRTAMAKTVRFTWS